MNTVYFILRLKTGVNSIFWIYIFVVILNEYRNIDFKATKKAIAIALTKDSSQ